MRRFRCMHARLRAHIRVQSCTCPPDGFCIAPDTIAYAKVSGAESIAWRTQLHLTPVSEEICTQLAIWASTFMFGGHRISRVGWGGVGGADLPGKSGDSVLHIEK